VVDMGNGFTNQVAHSQRLIYQSWLAFNLRCFNLPEKQIILISVIDFID